MRSLQQDLEAQREKNNVLENRSKSLEEVVEQVNADIKKTQLEKEATLKEKEASSQMCERLEKEIGEEKQKYEQVQRDLLSKEGESSEISSLREEVERSQKQLSDAAADHLAALKSKDDLLNSATEECNRVRSQLEQALSSNQGESENEACLNQTLADKEKELEQLRGQLSVLSKDKDTSVSEKDMAQKEVATLKADLTNKEETIGSLEENLASLRQELQAKLEELSRADQQESVDKVEELESRLTATEKSRSELESSSQELEARVEQYEKVLASTESMLRTLESSVESEERKWKEKVDDISQQLQQEKTKTTQLTEENQVLKQHTEGVEELDFAYSCVEKSLPHIITEMEGRVKELEDRLSVSESERDQLSQQLTQSLQTVSSLKHDLDESKRLSQEIPAEVAQGMSNGTASSGQPELQSKLEEANKQIELLNQANKQLSAKLDASAQNDTSQAS